MLYSLQALSDLLSCSAMSSDPLGSHQPCQVLPDVDGRSATSLYGRSYTLSRNNASNNALSKSGETLTSLVQDDVQMGDDRARRFDDALASLVDNLVPALEGEEEATADQRHDEALELASNIIQE